MSDVQDVLLKMKLLIPKKHVILVSHMRANTSVTSHVIGSHPDISGYYEMHIGYYSWKSFINQKLKFHEQNTEEPSTPVYFDKVLHSEHYVNPALFDNKNALLLIALREPMATINSIVKLYTKNNPAHPCATPQHAAEYYRDRVNDIADFAQQVPREPGFLYYDAEDITRHSKQTLEKIQHYMGLAQPFPEDYRQFSKTGERFAGDSSQHIHAGKILNKEGDTTRPDIDDALLQECQDAYVRCRTLLKSRSWAEESAAVSSVNEI